MHSVLWLVTPNKVTDDDVDTIMEKYYEDTNKIFFKDVTEEEKERYEENEEITIKMKEDGTWEFVSQFDILHKGAKGELVKIKELCKTFKDYVIDWLRYEYTEEGRCGYWKNPEGWFDCLEVGGRWENSLLLNDMSHSTQAMKKDIYLEAMHEKQYVDYKVTWKAYHRKKSKRKATVKLHTAGSWTDMNNYAEMEEFLETYGCYWPYHILALTSPEIDSYKHDGVWYSKETASEYEEEMMAHIFNKEYDYKTALKKQKQIWNKKAAEVWSKIPDSYWITVVDLHN